MALDTEGGRIAHLLRRSGFGPSTAELDTAVAAGLEATLERVLTPEQQPDDVDSRVPRESFDFSRSRDAVRWWLARMVVTRRPFLEKLTLFWHGLLTSDLRRTGGRPALMVQQIETYRRLALGSFRDLAVASAKDPAMILYLDNNQNRRGRPNENYARELMELFTIGIGNYTEEDVREAARAFTGWFQRDGQFQFVPGQHDNGPKTVLGFTGNWNGDDVIDILVRRPECARFIAHKLWNFFAYPAAGDAGIDAVAAAFTASGYDIRATMRALFSHPNFYSDRAYHALVKSPVEFSIGFARSFGAGADPAAFGLLDTMGQIPMSPPNVAGWPGGDDWISTSALIARYNFVNRTLRVESGAPGHVDVAALVAARGLSTSEAILDFVIDLMVDRDLPAEKRAALATYLVARDDGTPGPFTLNERTITNKMRGLIYLLATTPEYQLA